MQLFDNILDIEQQLIDSDGDLQIQNALARAREEYRWTLEYVIDTAAQQAGISEEEKAEAERIASGEEPDDGIEVPEMEADAAAAIQAEIERQRALEEQLRAEAVAAAEAELAAKEAEAARLAEEEAAAAAEAAEKQKEAEQADALMALLNNANPPADDAAASDDAAAGTRRRLQEERVMSMDFCMGEFVTGVFNTDCTDFARANQAEKKAAAEEAKA
jgi:hypothetical protein